uniref:PARP catalytic domain-containing protein n=1 Tax=Nothobranchius furzeri TaxID=105023 RepID=A0A8C6MH63_NOTFU
MVAREQLTSHRGAPPLRAALQKPAGAHAGWINGSGFRKSLDGMLGPGVCISRDLQKASRYPINHPDNEKAVIEVQVNMGKVICVDHQNHPLQKTWSSKGFDTTWEDCPLTRKKEKTENSCF